MIRKVSYLLLLVVVGVLVGCMDVKPNIREFVKGTAFLNATVNGGNRHGQPEYYYLCVTTKFDSASIAIELGNYEAVKLEDISENLLNQRSGVQTSKQEETNSIVYSFNGYEFWFGESKMFKFRATFVKRLNNVPVLWNRKMTKRYPFPLSQQDVEELFGKADRIRDYLSL